MFAMFGRQARFVAKFNDSPTLRDADFVLTPRALNACLYRPHRFLPGNRMPFAGVPEARNCNDPVVFLIAVTPKTGDDYRASAQRSACQRRVRSARSGGDGRV
jgi:cytochrome c2